jgi:hypothetical protein
MRILTANLMATVALVLCAVLCAPAALAQPMPRSIGVVQPGPPMSAGAGGTGGAGGGADSRSVVVVPVVQEADRTSACVTRGPPTRAPVTREGLSQAPALDPARKVNEVNCTQPFDFLGKGNLCCI